MNTLKFAHIASLLCAAILPLHILAQTAKPSPVGYIPFTLDSDNRIYVTSFANGSDSLRFIVDTGASTVVFNTNSPKLRRRIHEQEKTENIGTTGSCKITLSHDNHIKVGTVEYVDGIIGNNFLKRFNMLIDFSHKTIYLKPNKLLYTPFYEFLGK